MSTETLKRPARVRRPTVRQQDLRRVRIERHGHRRGRARAEHPSLRPLVFDGHPAIWTWMA